MLNEPELQKRFVKTGAICGLAVVLMYLTPKLLPLGSLGTYFFIYQGALLAAAFVGFYPFLSRPRTSIAAILATISGVFAGFCRMLFAVVQMTNLHYIRGFMREAETPEARQAWQNILNGVFTVQNGINFVADFFLDATVFLLSFVMWSHPRFGRAFAVTGFVAAGLHFFMKGYAFPEPPAEAGLFDAGPLISLWAGVVTIWILKNLSWMDEPQAGSV